MKKFKEYLLTTVGIALTAIALEYFFFPCDIVTLDIFLTEAHKYIITLYLIIFLITYSALLTTYTSDQLHQTPLHHSRPSI